VARRGVRLIVRSLRAHPGPHALAMLGATGFVVATVASAWVLGWITDEVIVGSDEGQADRRELGLAAAAVIGLSVASGVSVVMRRWFLVMATFRTQRDWRRQLLHRYVDLPLSFHLQRSAGELLAHADADLETATMVLQPLAFALSVVLLVIAALAALLAVHPLLALIAAVLFPVLAVMSRIYTRVVEAPSAEVQRRVGEVSAVAHESFDGAEVVKTLGREPFEVERLTAASQRLRAERIRVGRVRGTFEPLIDALPTVGTIALLVTGAWLVDRGSASPGDLVLAATLFSLLAMPLRIVGFFLEEMPRSVVSLERVDGVLDLPVEERRVAERTLPEGPLSLEIEGLAVTHAGRRVLDGVSLSVAPGETVALVGATGSGKSTLLEAVAGLVETEEGRIRLSGIGVDRIDPVELSNAVALVFQETFLFADTLLENVTLQGGASGVGVYGASDGETPTAGAAVSGDRVRAALESAAADEFIDALKHRTATVVGERGVTLSGGQRQRVALARALIRNPGLLMLDDATSAIDPVVEGRILANLRRGLATTAIVVAHRVSAIELADRVAFLRDGRIVATGSHAELLSRRDYRSLVRAYETSGATGGLQ